MNKKELSENLSPEMSRKSIGLRCSIVGIIANLCLASAKLIIGIISSSIAIIADSLNNFTDSASSIMSFVSFKLAAKPADKSHPFGHARIEYIISMLVSMLVLVVGFELFTESVSGFFNDEESELDFNTVTFVVLGISVVGKLLLALYYRSVAIKIDSSVIKASYVDSLSDSIATLAITVSAIIIKYTGFTYADSIVGLLVSLMIFKAGIEILNDTKNSLLGEAPLADVVDKINAIVAKHPVVIGVHDMMVHNYGPNHYISSFHAEVDGTLDIYELHDEIDNVEREISSELGILCTIHMDPIEVNDEKVNELRSFVSEMAKKVCPESTIHDFRTVVGQTHTNLIFDLVLPFDIKDDPEAVVESLKSAIAEERPNHYCVVTIDRG